MGIHKSDGGLTWSDVNGPHPNTYTTWSPNFSSSLGQITMRFRKPQMGGSEIEFTKSIHENHIEFKDALKLVPGDIIDVMMCGVTEQYEVTNIQTSIGFNDCIEMFIESIYSSP